MLASNQKDDESAAAAVAAATAQRIAKAVRMMLTEQCNWNIVQNAVLWQSHHFDADCSESFQA